MINIGIMVLFFHDLSPTNISPKGCILLLCSLFNIMHIIRNSVVRTQSKCLYPHQSKCVVYDGFTIMDWIWNIDTDHYVWQRNSIPCHSTTRFRSSVLQKFLIFQPGHWRHDESLKSKFLFIISKYLVGFGSWEA